MAVRMGVLPRRRRTRAGWLAATATLVLIAAAPGAASPDTAPAPQNSVAFVSELHASEIYVARVDGTAQRRLTNDVVGSRWPALSPDGTQIAYARRHATTWSIIVSKLGGAGARDLAAEAGFTMGFSGYPDWSPDGTQVIFSHQDFDGHVAIVDFDLATGAHHEVTHDIWSDLWPRFSPDGTRIAFAENVGGNGFDIMTIGADGSNPTRVTTGQYWEVEPTWSPDGKQIAYSESSSEDIFIVNAGGSSPRDVTNSPRSDDEEPVWTSRGLYFRGTPSGTEQLEFIRPDGTGLRRITTGVYENSDPDASRDGSRLVFVSGRNARTEVTVQSPAFRALTHGPIDSDPSWSHDHRQLAFAHFRGAGSQDIYVERADGSHLRNLTRGRGVNWAPAWSPDGKRIAFVRFESFGSQIWVMKSDGTGQRALTTLGDLNDHPSWSPDGRSIVFSGRRNGNYDLYILDVRTGTDLRLTRTPRAELQPAWSPDGALIAFTATAPGNTSYNGIYVISPRGGAARVLTTGLGTNSNSAPTWSPDGSTIIFESEVFLGHDTDLWTVPRNGGTAARYTSFEWNERTPSW
jgi:Tol biopolymer transport system component